MKKFFALLLITTLIFISCRANTGITPTQVDSSKLTKYSEIYIAALESFIPIDPGLNSGMKYIAIYTKCLTGASEEDKKAVLGYFKKYGVKVMDESFDSLKLKGMVKEGNSIEGILLTIESINFNSNTEVVVNGSKFRSGLGAIGIKSILKFKNGKWKVEKTDMTWIS